MKPLVYKKSRRVRGTEPARHKLHVAKNDTVRVIRGDDKGKEGKIRHVYPKRHPVTVAGVNIVKQHQQLGLTNPHQIPKLLRIVLNVGRGDAPKNPKGLEAAVAELGAITGQRPVVTRAKKAIANFNLRQGLPIGCAVTLRGARMYEFLDRFISVSVPRMRDFRGLPTDSFDGRGNYTLGIKEQMIFPEIDYDKVERIHRMDITFVTDAGRDDTAIALLREMGVPFRGESPVAVS